MTHMVRKDFVKGVWVMAWMTSSRIYSVVVDMAVASSVVSDPLVWVECTVWEVDDDDNNDEVKTPCTHSKSHSKTFITVRHPS